MAERYAVANGVWSDTATWDGGTLPGVGDDVYTNTYTVTVDQDVTVLSLRNGAGTTAAAGGEFQVSGNWTINADVRAGGSRCLVLLVNGINVIVNGDVYGGTTGGTFGAIHVSAGTAPTLTVNGDVAGGSVSNGYGLRAVPGNINVNGNIVGGTGSNAHGLYQQTSGTSVIIGNVTGPSGGGGSGIHNNGDGVITVTGAVQGGTSAGGGGGISNTGTGTMTVNGDVTGSSTSSGQPGMRCMGTSTNTINGNAIGGSDVLPGVYVTTGTLTLVGNAQASSTASGVVNDSTGLVILRGNQITGANGHPGIARNLGGGKILCHASDPLAIIQRCETSGAPGDARSLWTSNHAGL